MRNTYNVSLLRRRILDAMPRTLTDVGQAAVDGFLSLPGASAWRPERMGLTELSFVFDIGVPFALIGDNASVKMIALSIGDAVRDGRHPEKSVWSVVHAAALLCRWGATVEFLPGGAAATNAWRIGASWSGGPTFDVVRHGSDLDGAGASSDAAPSGGDRPLLIAREVNGAPEDAAVSLDEVFAHSPNVNAALFFQPRFWIGVEQKEWLYLARLSPTPRVALAPEQLGGADGHRRALRLALLV
jgi:hypothetical protein